MWCCCCTPKWRKFSFVLACCRHVTRICDRICRCISGGIDWIRRWLRLAACECDDAATAAGGDGDAVDVVDTTERAVLVDEDIDDAVVILLVCLRFRGPRSSCTAARFPGSPVWLDREWDLLDQVNVRMHRFFLFFELNTKMTQKVYNCAISHTRSHLSTFNLRCSCAISKNRAHTNDIDAYSATFLETNFSGTQSYWFVLKVFGCHMQKFLPNVLFINLPNAFRIRIVRKQCVGIIRTTDIHAGLEASLQSTIWTPIASRLIDGTIAFASCQFEKKKPTELISDCRILQAIQSHSPMHA